MSKKLFYYGSTASFSNLYSNNYGGTNEDAVCADNAAHKPASLSFGIWIKSPVAAGVEMWMAKRLNVGGNASFALFSNAGSTVASIFGGGVNYPLAVAGFAANTWQHWMVTYDGTTLSAYLNGVFVTSSAPGVAISHSATYGLSQGGYIDTFFATARGYHGCLYNTAINAAGVAAVHAAKGADLRNIANSANLVSAYKFNGTSDYPILTDYVSGINATMTNQEAADINTDIPV